MSRPRLFDWDDAQRLREAGISYTEIGRRLGVSHAAVYWACNPARRAEARQRSAAWQRQGVCVECGAQCTRTGGQPQHRCRTCYVKAMATSVRDSELRCVTCREWKRDTEFPRSRHVRARARRGRHGNCRVCTTAAKRAYRERTRVPCVDGCGTMVPTADRRDKTKPPRCLPCAMRHVYGYPDSGRAA